MNMNILITPILIHLFITITPGPANILIMQRSSANGRIIGLLTAYGVITGSAMWGMIAFLTIIFSRTLPIWITQLLGMIGVIYLIYLGLKIIKGRKNKLNTNVIKLKSYDRMIAFIQGFMIHATNPKALLGWVAIISVGRLDIISSDILITIIILCILQATIIFNAYALLFSTNNVVLLYQKYRKWIDLIIGSILIFFATITLYYLGEEILTFLLH